MVKLKCRSCGGEIDSDEKARKCRHCNELLPFECAVCSKRLRPPLPEFPVERYYNEEGKPLCANHYQRECPECANWFRADENPGFFLCPNCTKRHQIANANASSRTPSHADHHSDDYDDADDERAANEREDDQAYQFSHKDAQNGVKSGCVGVFALTFLVVAALPYATVPLIRFLWHL